MSGFRPRPTLLLGILVIGVLATRAPALAQSDDHWSFVLTPQVWDSHVAKNGFAAPRGLGSIAI